MDTYEATKIVMSRIQKLDQENASKIMGYILIQDQGEKEMIRLAFVPENLLISFMNQAKSCLGLSSNIPFSTPRILIPNNGSFPRSTPKPISYASVLNGSNPSANNCSNNSLNSSSLHFYGGNDELLSGGGGDGVHHPQVQDQLSFFDDSVMDPIMSPSERSDSLIFPYGEDVNTISSPHPHHPFHRRSCSVNDAAFIEEMGNGSGFGWRPCVYFAKGFCKNGTNCKFLHSDETFEVGSPNKGVSEFDELLRMKALQQQRLALMVSESYHPFAYSKSMNFVNDQRSAAAALMMGDEFHKFSRSRSEKYDFSPIGLGPSSTSRQIYLTFPSESTFKEEDVSGYFSMFGPVQDVRIPYQQKRMFGFVTFVFPETVKLILAKGNPHFVCDSRVLVKPYKEKGKVPDKKHMERGEYSTCLSPSEVDPREPFMLFNTQEMMFRRKLEQEAELQNAIELQSRRVMNLQLMDLKNKHHNHRFLPSLTSGVPISSPIRQSQLLMNQNFISSSEVFNQELSEEFDGRTKSPDVQEDYKKLVREGTESSMNESINSVNKQHDVNTNDSDYLESLEHVLPDNLFASPTKLAAEHQSVFSQSSFSTDDSKISSTNTSSNNSSPLNMTSLKSCYFQMP
ncbi:hypothetical protein RD792_003157, partial [Penstemon davidsonii]